MKVQRQMPRPVFRQEVSVLEQNVEKYVPLPHVSTSLTREEHEDVLHQGFEMAEDSDNTGLDTRA